MFLKGNSSHNIRRQSVGNEIEEFWWFQDCLSFKILFSLFGLTSNQIKLTPSRMSKIENTNGVTTEIDVKSGYLITPKNSLHYLPKMTLHSFQ